MTCIVGLVQDGKVYMGGDSLATSGSHGIIRDDPKVFKNGEFLIGYTSSFRMGQLLAHKFSPPKQKEHQDVFAYMVTDFIDAIRECFKDSGFATKHNEEERGGNFLVGYRGSLFEIDTDYQVGKNSCKYAAVGSGYSYALGALHTLVTPELNFDPTQALYLALEASAEFCNSVRGPFMVENI